jgi:transcriptional regulator with XRE-family HTH domain
MPEYSPMVTPARAVKKNKDETEGPDPIDIHVGARVRLRRNLVGLSQEQLGKALGLTFQQVQKYERGANRMGASRLYQLSRILNIPVNWFFEDLSSAPHRAAGFAENKQSELEDIPADKQELARSDAETFARRETLDLIRAYYRISDPKQRRKVYELIKSMAIGE